MGDFENEFQFQFQLEILRTCFRAVNILKIKLLAAASGCQESQKHIAKSKARAANLRGRT